MRILIATGIYPPEIGGPATYSKLLNDELPKFGFVVDILAFRDVRHLPNAIRHIAYCIKVLKVGRKCDLIFAQDPVSVGWPALFANLILRKPFIVKVVGDHVWEQGTQRSGMTDNLDGFTFSYFKHPYFAFLRLLQQIVVRYADKVIVPSEYLKSILIEWGVKSDKIRVIYNGFTRPEISEKREIIRNRLGWKNKIILSAGRLVPWKGFALLIDTMSEIIKAYPTAKLIIVGDGPQYASLSNKIKDLNLESNITLIGKLDHDEMIAYISAADIFVLNTGYEGLSHFLLEAMALETPIITTKVGGNVELIENNISGILIPYNNKDELYTAIHSVLSEDKDTKSFTAAAKIKVNDFSKENMLKDLVKFLKEI